MAEKISQSNVAFKVYENNTELLGIASVTLPNISWVTQTISGAGIAGSYDTVIAGQVQSMSLTLNFQMVTSAAVSLLKPEIHTVTLMVAEQQREVGQAALTTVGVKHLFEIIPMSLNTGSISPASPMNASGTYSVVSWTCERDGVQQWSISLAANKCIVNGTDYAQDLNQYLGQN